MIDRALRHPIRASLWALVIALASVIALALLTRTGTLDHVFDRIHPLWLALALAAELASICGYALAYQRVAKSVGGRRLSPWLSVQMVLAGFGTFAFFGGFALDRRMLRRAGARPRAAGRSVLALGVVELVVLSAGAFVAALVLLVEHSPVAAGMIWPWLIGVPVVTTTLLAMAYRGARRGERAWMPERLASTAAQLVASLVSEPFAWLGIAAYFAGDIVALGFALKIFGVGIDPGRLIIAYTSGFLFTRRTLPLASAGVVEALLTASLVWVGAAGLAPALAAVVAFRILNLGGLGLLALLARHRLMRTYGLQRERSVPVRRSLPAVAAEIVTPDPLPDPGVSSGT